MVWSSRFLQHHGKMVVFGFVSLGLCGGCGSSSPEPKTPPPGQYAPLSGAPAEPVTEAPPPNEPPPKEEPKPEPAEPAFSCPGAPEGVPAAPTQGPRVAIVLLIDRSKSMKGAAHDKAKEAALGGLGALQSQDWFGVIGYEKVARSYVRTQAATARGRMQIGIRRMGTDRAPSRLGPAFDLAREHLEGVAAKHEHVIVLTNSDVDQAAADAAVVLAKTGATISTIAFGDAPDKERTACAPKVGRGQTVWLDSPDGLPEQLKKEIERVLAQ